MGGDWGPPPPKYSQTTQHKSAPPPAPAAAATSLQAVEAAHLSGSVGLKVPAQWHWISPPTLIKVRAKSASCWRGPVCTKRGSHEKFSSGSYDKSEICYLVKRLQSRLARPLVPAGLIYIRNINKYRSICGETRFKVVFCVSGVTCLFGCLS